jgi:hypothetical protein
MEGTPWLGRDLLMREPSAIRGATYAVADYGFWRARTT